MANRSLFGQKRLLTPFSAEGGSGDVFGLVGFAGGEAGEGAGEGVDVAGPAGRDVVAVLDHEGGSSRRAWCRGGVPEVLQAVVGIGCGNVEEVGRAGED